jgi:quercetin dioxygenase-like cupin family protein
MLDQHLNELADFIQSMRGAQARCIGVAICRYLPSMIGVVFLAMAVSGCVRAGSIALPSAIKIETLTQSTSAWDATPYRRYPNGQPLISVLRITVAPHTALDWHSHPMPNAAYVLSGELTVERKDGIRKRFVAGQALTETVDRIHRSVTGEIPVVLIVFYAGVPGLPLSQAASS